MLILSRSLLSLLPLLLLRLLVVVTVLLLLRRAEAAGGPQIHESSPPVASCRWLVRRHWPVAVCAELVSLYVSRTQHEELLALQRLGGISGLARALRTDLRLGLPSCEGPNDGSPKRGSAERPQAIAKGDTHEGEKKDSDLKEAWEAVQATRKQVFGENVLPQRPPTRKRKNQALNPDALLAGSAAAVSLPL